MSLDAVAHRLLKDAMAAFKRELARRGIDRIDLLLPDDSDGGIIDRH